MNSIFILHYEKDQNQRIQLQGNKGIGHSAQQEIKWNANQSAIA